MSKLQSKTHVCIVHRTWTKTYAKDPEEVHADRIKKVIAQGAEMGMVYTEAQAKTALEKNAWDEIAAINSLLGA